MYEIDIKKIIILYINVNIWPKAAYATSSHVKPFIHKTLDKQP